MATTEDQIAKMRAVAHDLSRRPEIQSAWVDDWGRFGNFTLMVCPHTANRHSTRRIQAASRKALAGTGAHVREVFAPDPVIERCLSPSGHPSKRVVGYARDYWVVDVDFEQFHPEINRFSSQL